ncbi:MAG: glycosyltransferase family 4 protein [Clostridia bacterium]|nr:glycosyltransferase family 4 protein [Clostridia bacterium]
MKILRVPAYCYPELTASTHLEEDRQQAFAKAGFEVDIHTPTATRGIDKQTYEKYKKIRYEEKYDGKIKIYRFPMFREGTGVIGRAVRYVLTNLIQYHKGVKTRGVDVIYAVSTPPTQGLLCAKIAQKLSKKYKKKVPLIYNLQDVFPDSLVTTGISKEGSILWKIGRKMEDYTYQNADRIIVISESMRENIMNKGVPADKISLIPNWIDTDVTKNIPKQDNPLFEEFGIPTDKYTVVYAGNFGQAQGADVVLYAAEKLLGYDDVQFVIFGGGAQFEAAKAIVTEKNLKNVIINPLLPQDKVPSVYSLGDVAIITTKKGVGNSAMPSKTWSIMACETPIIATVDQNSELSSILKSANAGISVEPENADLLAKAILDMKDTKTSYCGGRDYVLANASKAVCTQKHVDVIKSQLENNK